MCEKIQKAAYVKVNLFNFNASTTTHEKHRWTSDEGFAFLNGQ